MKPPWIVLLAVLTGFLFGFSIMWRVGYAHSQALDAQIAQLKLEKAQAESDLAAGREMAHSMETDQLSAARAIGATRLQLPEPGGTGANKQGDGGSLARILKNPEMRKMLAAQQAAALRELYTDYLLQSHLTPEETERFFELLQDRQMALVDSSVGAITGGSIDVNAANAATNAADNALKDLLGPERFAKYEDFEKTLGARVQVQQFNRQLAGQGNPLQDYQNVALLQIMIQANDSMPVPGAQSATMRRSDVDEYAQEVRAVNAHTFDQARSILNPPQLSAFATFQKSMEKAQIEGLEMAHQMTQSDQ